MSNLYIYLSSYLYSHAFKEYLSCTVHEDGYGVWVGVGAGGLAFLVVVLLVLVTARRICFIQPSQPTSGYVER